MKQNEIVFLNEDDVEEKYEVVKYTQHEQEGSEGRKNTSQASERNNWEYDETIAFLALVQEHFEDLDHPGKRKTVWNTISSELAQQEILFSSESCRMKWRNLSRTYKSSKELRRKSRNPATRFNFYDRMDELLGDKCDNSDAPDEEIVVQVAAPPKKSPPLPAQSKKRKCESPELSPAKEHYYKDKRKIAWERHQVMLEIEKEKLEMKQNVLRLMQEKNDIDRRQAEALETLVQVQKSQAGK